MLDVDEADSLGADPETRVVARIERGLARAEAGELDAALADLEEAEEIAREADRTALVATARINRGYVHSVRGEVDVAMELYATAADIAREADDLVLLRSALSNLGVMLRTVRRDHDAIAAYDEYIELLAEAPNERAQAYIDRGLSRAEIQRYPDAVSDFEEAERIAREIGALDLAALARYNQGYVLDRDDDPTAALVVYREAVDIARSSASVETLTLALLNLAQSHSRLGQHSEADPVFAEVEELYRDAGEQTELANALYWHASSLRDGGWQDRALDKWREEEPLRRELGQDGDLADCLLEQALILRKRAEYDAAEPLYIEAQDICRREGLARGLAAALYQHGLMLRADCRFDEALERAREAATVAGQVAYPQAECRAHALSAMVLADMGDVHAAIPELDVAETMCGKLGYDKMMVWMLARRAYLFAREDKAAEELTGQLSRSYEYAVDHELERTGRTAVRSVVSDINARCGETYDQVLAEFRSSLLEMKDEMGPPTGG